jgi:hypothetical protein
MTSLWETMNINFHFLFQTLGTEQRFEYATPSIAFGQVSLLPKWLHYMIHHVHLHLTTQATFKYAYVPFTLRVNSFDIKTLGIFPSLSTGFILVIR